MTNTADQYAIGVDFGGTKMLGAAVTRDGSVLETSRVPTPYEGEELLDAIGGLVEELESAVGSSSSGVGVGAAGLVDREGVLRFGPNVGGVTGVDVLGGVQKRLPNRIVRVDNDNTCATWGECLFGAGRGVGEMVFVGLGTGIGCGMVVDGRLTHGQHGFSAEAGHMTVDAHGIDCVCGKVGCWEAYSSGRAVGRTGRELAGAGRAARLVELAGSVDAIRGEHVTTAAREGDRDALEVMDQLSWWLALGVSNLIAILDPQRVVIGGGMSGDFDLFFEQTRKYLDEMVFGGSVRPPVSIVAAELGSNAGAVGAAMLVYGDTLAEMRIS